MPASSKEFLKLWRELLNDARMNNRGIFNAQHTEAFTAHINAEWDKVFETNHKEHHNAHTR